MLNQEEKKMRAAMLLALERSGGLKSLDESETRIILEMPEAEWPESLKVKLSQHLNRLSQESQS